MKSALRKSPWLLVLVLAPTLLVPPSVYAANEVMGEIQFKGVSHIEKTSGVWVDGEYVGYLKELKRTKKVLLLPGPHRIVVRQDGYQDFTDEVVVQPGEKQVVSVAMEKAPNMPLPKETSTIKIEVNPLRAAVFVDGLFVGHVAEFNGVGRGMLVAPGTHRIKVALPGYQTFETDINPLADQKVVIKTNLVWNGAPLAEPLIKPEGSGPSASAPQPAGLQQAQAK
jgi:hypothetical protein